MMVRILGAALVALAMLGCGASFADIERAAAGGDVSAKLAKCRGEARAAFFVEGKGEQESLARYESCKKREGLQ